MCVVSDKKQQQINIYTDISFLTLSLVFLTSLITLPGCWYLCICISYRAQTDWSPLSGPGSVGLRMDASVSRLQSQAQSAWHQLWFSPRRCNTEITPAPAWPVTALKSPAWPSLASGEETPGRVCVQAVMVKAGLPLPYLPPPSLPLLRRLG